jgi:hypothetical protein
MSHSRVEIRIDRSRCVLCGEANDCAMARGDDGQTNEAPCWCVGEAFPGRLLERARDTDDGASCICRRCLERAASEPAKDD